jgi:CheY-like chemotaxis protein
MLSIRSPVDSPTHPRLARRDDPMTAQSAGVDPLTDPPLLLRVLVADDNRDAADSLAALVRLWGHEACVAYDGVTALKLVDSNPPDVVLADLAMPTLDGRKLAQHMRASAGGSYFTLVAVTGFADDRQRNLALAAGFDHYLVKPVEPADVQCLLTEVERRTRAAVTRGRELIGQASDHVRQTRELVDEARRYSTRGDGDPTPPDTPS